jgi:hypothetical protein
MKIWLGLYDTTKAGANERRGFSFSLFVLRIGQGYISVHVQRIEKNTPETEQNFTAWLPEPFRPAPSVVTWGLATTQTTKNDQACRSSAVNAGHQDRLSGAKWAGLQ